jgi:diaminopimelate epimerase
VGHARRQSGASEWFAHNKKQIFQGQGKVKAWQATPHPTVLQTLSRSQDLTTQSCPTGPHLVNIKVHKQAALQAHVTLHTPGGNRQVVENAPACTQGEAGGGGAMGAGSGS